MASLGIARSIASNAKVSMKNPGFSKVHFSTASSLGKQLSTKLSTLPNGLRVASEDGFGETATVGVWIDAGSVYETKENNGTAHFLEHLSFKGTNKRTQQQLETEIENMGGQLNAYTSREQTVYYAKVFKKDVSQAVDILADILQNSKLSEESIERERSTILREMQEVETSLEEVVFDHLHSIAFQGTSLGYTILGSEANVKSLKRPNITEYIQRHYTGPRMVLTAAGGVEHGQLVSLAEKAFGNLPKQSPLGIIKRPEIKFTGSMVTIRDDEMPLVHIAYAAQSVGWTHPDYYVFMVIQAIIGNWDRTMGASNSLSSRLCETVFLEKLAHSVSSFQTPYHSTGLFGVYATTPEDKVEDLSHEILKEWVRISDKVSNAEVERAKARVRSSILMQLDGSSAVAEDIGRQILTLGKRQTAEEIFRKIELIDVATVKRVASEFFYDTDPVIAAIGPIEHVPDYNQLRGWTTNMGL